LWGSTPRKHILASRSITQRSRKGRGRHYQATNRPSEILFCRIDDSPSYDSYESNGMLSNAGIQQSQSWEAAQKEEAHQEVNKEALVYVPHPSSGEQVKKLILKSINIL